MSILPGSFLPFLTGESLKKAITESKNKREAFADGFLYKQTILMIAADPGAGKSTITTQIAVELAAGLPLFGMFETTKPLKVAYVQTERSIIELLERIEVISETLPIIYENLFITDECQKLNLINPAHADIFIKCILRDCPNVDVIIIDPIYAMVSGGLKDDIPASAFTKAMSNLQKATGATLLYTHHTVKSQYNSHGNVIQRDDPFYGSQWLKAHVTGSYYLKECEGGVELIKKKDNYGLLSDHITLNYNSETSLCSINSQELPAIEKVRNFLKIKKADHKSFTFNDLLLWCRCHTRTLRKVLLHPSISEEIIFVTTNKNKKLYKCKE